MIQTSLLSVSQQKIRQLQGFDFGLLNHREKILMEQLSGFTFQSSFLNLLKKNYGNTNIKEKFVLDNTAYLNPDDLAIYNQQALKYRKQSRDGTIAITGLFTISALIYGIIRLPARRSATRYTAIGFGLGLVCSYVFWRMQLHRFDNQMNMLFHKVVREQYEQMKGYKF